MIQTTPALIRRLLLARGADPEDTLSLSTLSPPLGPQGFLGMSDAMQVMATAIAQQWPVTIVGDYDVDGACATAILRKGLESVLPVTSIVPNRLTEGYGLSESVADRIAPDTRLVITVDNGISAHAGIVAAKARGMAVIVTDHHLPASTRPPADVIIDPNQPGCPFPWKSTCGAGVAWYFLWAMHLTHPAWIGKETLEETLDLVALATVADLVPLERNNRVLVANGLRRIRAGKINPGLSGIVAFAGLELAQIREQDFAFRLGPRLNAAGRLADMQTGIRLLLSRDAQAIESWSRFLETVNAQRKEVQAHIEQEAMQITENLRDTGDPVICVGNDGWHSGVVGIVASKLKERYQRPAFVFTSTGDVGQTAQGSGRSMDGWHLRDALALVESRNPGLLNRFGGHAMAAGLSLPKTRFEEFRRSINAISMEQIPGGQFKKAVWCDGPLQAAELTLDMARAIEQAGPWGQGFPEPLFENDFVVMFSKPIKNGHWKLQLQLADGMGAPRTIDAVHFLNGREVAQEPPPVGFRVRAQYRLQVNRWQGRETVQLMLEQVLPAPAPVAMPVQESQPVFRPQDLRGQQDCQQAGFADQYASSGPS
ncbi:single-stranded-DNA-specific exonuclease RecJ [Acidithiobacillus sp. M4-SHS-6]|uniref:single-stranded-DNA-specific exonuclease RecJ n=1 Tax=Acidithiobacillus sp. M4-SHS-6 TaxID=3383024 RepID=UPI0039BE2D66